MCVQCNIEVYKGNEESWNSLIFLASLLGPIPREQSAMIKLQYCIYAPKQHLRQQLQNKIQANKTGPMFLGRMPSVSFRIEPDERSSCSSLTNEGGQ